MALKIYDKLLKSDATNEEGLLCGIGRIFLQVHSLIPDLRTRTYTSVETFLVVTHAVSTLSREFCHMFCSYLRWLVTL